MRLAPCWLVLALAGCAPDGSPATGVSSFDDTACRPLGGTVSGVAFTDAQATAVVDMIDHATAAELDAVPSIGPSTANAIIAARPFGTSGQPLAKLDAVSGIGATVLSALRDNVTTDWCALADGRQSCCGGGAPPAPGSCTALGGTYDGAKLTAAEECHAIDFLNQARMSEMSAIPEAPRHKAYDCKPAPTANDPHAIACGYRSSLWTSLAEYSSVTGVGKSALSGLKSSAATWQRNGLSYDTVANTWQTRSALLNKEVSLDAVYVTKRLPDETGTTPYYCVEVRDSETAPNFFSACINVNAIDPATNPCPNGACADNMVGQWLRMRGTVRSSSFQPGGYKVNLAKGVPEAADPAVLAGSAPLDSLDCSAIATLSGGECGGLGYAEWDCIEAWLTSHHQERCTAYIQDQLVDDT